MKDTNEATIVINKPGLIITITVSSMLERLGKSDLAENFNHSDFQSENIEPEKKLSTEESFSDFSEPIPKTKFNNDEYSFEEEEEWIEQVGTNDLSEQQGEEIERGKGGRKKGTYTLPPITEEFKAAFKSHSTIKKSAGRARKEVDCAHEFLKQFWCISQLIQLKELVEEREIETAERDKLRKEYNAVARKEYYRLPFAKKTNPKYYGQREWLIVDTDESYILKSRDPRNNFSGHKFTEFKRKEY